MTLPDFQATLLPLLKRCASGEELRTRDVVETIADELRVDEDERKKLLPSGSQPIFENRVFWAATYLKKAGLLESTRWGHIRITDLGRKVLDEKPARIDTAFLSRFPSFVQFMKGGPAPTPQPIELKANDTGDRTPEERIEAAWSELRRSLADELLGKVRSCSPSFFERLVVRVLVTMGYGGSLADAGQSIGRSGDGGIDGVIKEDKLGLERVYVQAKRWQASVGGPEVQGFAGSLEGAKAKKGVFITTSSFTPAARKFVDQIEKRIVLIDGPTLVNLMIDYGVGVSTAKTYSVQKVDSEYFDE